MRHHLEASDSGPTPAGSGRRAVGTVVAVLDGEVVVNIDGILRRASARRVPRLRVGDWVMVGLDAVLGRVDTGGRPRP
jgi:hypothetical protein